MLAKIQKNLCNSKNHIQIYNYCCTNQAIGHFKGVQLSSARLCRLPEQELHQPSSVSFHRTRRTQKVRVRVLLGWCT